MGNIQSLCRSCSRVVVYTANIAGKKVPSEYCERRIACFPDCQVCRDYERAPGSDDE